VNCQSCCQAYPVYGRAHGLSRNGAAEVTMKLTFKDKAHTALEGLALGAGTTFVA
jgi:hypothetical protein